jgi:hypothetical protein
MDVRGKTRRRRQFALPTRFFQEAASSTLINAPSANIRETKIAISFVARMTANGQIILWKSVAAEIK